MCNAYLHMQNQREIENWASKTIFFQSFYFLKDGGQVQEGRRHTDKGKQINTKYYILRLFHNIFYV